MGEIYRPEDILRRGKKPVSDLPPTPITPRSIPSSIEKIVQEIESLKAEIETIKRALRIHGITIE